MFYQRRSISHILKEGSRLYLKHMRTLTRPLFYPLLAQIVGIALWVFLAYESVDLVTATFPRVNIWVLWGIFVLANLPGLYIFLHGFWQYLIWVSGLNLMVRELMDTGGKPDSRSAYLRITNRSTDYALIWSFLFGLVFLPLAFAVLPIAIGASNPNWYAPALVIGIGIFLVSTVLASMALVFCSLGFQTFAFSPGHAGASLFRSVDLVSHGFIKTLALLCVWLAVTQFILPSLVTWAMDALQMTRGLAWILQGFVQFVLTQNAEDVVSLEQTQGALVSLYNWLGSHVEMVAIELAHAIVFTFVSALLLPLGTCWFALLYADLKVRLDLSQTPPVLREPLTTGVS